MTASISRAAPIRFLFGVVIVWTIGRGLTVYGWSPEVEPVPPKPAAEPIRSVAAAQPIMSQQLPSLSPIASPIVHRADATQRVSFVQKHAAPRPTFVRIAAKESGMTPSPAPVQATASPNVPPQTPPMLTPLSAVAPSSTSRSRLSGSAWLFARGSGGPALAPGGQIGGGQAGVRLLYALDGARHLAVAARLSTTVGGPRQSEAAFGLDWTPVANVPVHLIAQRRVAIDQGGRNAWEIGAAGGVYAFPVARGWRLDGYAEAGVVGARRRDLYGDGAVRIARSFDLGEGRSLAIGPGACAAAQPGAERFDVGPSTVLRWPVMGKTLAVALDWRQRVAGGAKPGSGPALTVGVDF